MIKKIIGITMLFVGMFILNALPITTVGIGICLLCLMLVVEGLKLMWKKK